MSAVFPSMSKPELYKNLHFEIKHNKHNIISFVIMSKIFLREINFCVEFQEEFMLEFIRHFNVIYESDAISWDARALDYRKC